MPRKRRIGCWIVALLPIILVVAFLWPTAPPEGVGIADAMVADPTDKPIPARIWYPQAAPSGGSSFPLVVISHGTGGSLNGHVDTAVALAKAGFVAVALDHTGDNYGDQSYADRGLHLVGRPRHVSRVIDHMLQQWRGPAPIDPARIGVFGHSAGGFTALVLAGGTPDLRHGAEHCRARPDAWDCLYLKRHGLDLARYRAPVAQVRGADPRVRAISISAPAVGYTFRPSGLAKVTIPVQIWAAQRDEIVEDSPAVIHDLSPRPSDYRLVPNAGHFSFLVPCGWRTHGIALIVHWTGGPKICTDPTGFDRAAFHQGYNRDVVAFFRKALPARPSPEARPRP